MLRPARSPQETAEQCCEKARTGNGSPRIEKSTSFEVLYLFYGNLRLCLNSTNTKDYTTGSMTEEEQKQKKNASGIVRESAPSTRSPRETTEQCCEPIAHTLTLCAGSIPTGHQSKKRQTPMRSVRSRTRKSRRTLNPSVFVREFRLWRI